MILQGTVTKINEELLSFEVDKITTVYTALLHKEQKLPAKDSKIRITSPYFISDEFKVVSIVLCPETSSIDGHFPVEVSKTQNSFLKLITSLKLGPWDILEFDKHYRFLRKNFFPQHAISSEQIVECVIKMLVNQNGPENNDDTRVIPHFNLKLISHTRFLNDNCELYKTTPYWSYGHYWSWHSDNTAEYFIGFLTVCDKSGMIYFTDFKREVPCIITNITNSDISKYLNAYVLIQDHIIFTETYNSKKLCSFEYLLVDVSKIMLLNLDGISSTDMILEKPSSHLVNALSFSFVIISKSLPMINSNKSLECWLEIMLRDGKKMFLCLNWHFANLYPRLKQNYIYKVFHKSSLKKRFNKELNALNNSYPQYELPNNSVFVSKDLVFNQNNKENILDVNQANLQLLQSTQMISFEGMITVKKFVKPLSSRTEKIIASDIFGTPGDKTHVLVFDVDGTPLTLYLNNWENTAAPYCLIPRMRVVVRNVISQKGKYYKSTPFTSFEVVRYEPLARFDTCDLSDWGRPYFLGAGPVIPEGVVIWARVCSFIILGTKIKHECEACREETNFGRSCTKCGSVDAKRITASITLITRDQMGESKVIAKNEYGVLLLQVLLGAQKPVFEKWKESFSFVDKYEYSIKNNCDDYGDVIGETDSFKDTLTRAFNVINKIGLSLDLKCRKISRESNGNSLYFLLDARRS